MSQDIVTGPVLDPTTGEDSVSTEVAVPTTAQLARRIETLTADKAVNAIAKGGKALEKLRETTDGLAELNSLIGARVKENETFLGAYAYALYCTGENKAMTAKEFADAKGFAKSRSTQLARTWRLFSEFDIHPGSPEWSMTSTWQNSSEATALFAKKGPKATREEFLTAYAESKRAKPATITTGDDTTDTTGDDTTGDTTDTTGDAPNTADNASQSGTSATGDTRVNRPNGESNATPDMPRKALDKARVAQTAIAGIRKDDAKGETREVLVAMASAISLLLA